MTSLPERSGISPGRLSSGHWALIGVLVALLAVRFAYIRMDPPGGILCWSGAYLADEALYLKPAKLYHSFHVWRNEQDLNASYYHSFLFVLWTMALSQAFGPDLLVCRYASVVVSIASIFVFYRICRCAMARTGSLVSCTLVAASFDHFAYSRLAFAEPLGALLSLVGILFWVNWRGQRRNVVASTAMAVLAVLAKLNLAYVFLTIALLWLRQAASAFLTGRRRLGAEILAIQLAACCVLGAARAAIEHGAADDARLVRALRGGFEESASVQDLLRNETWLMWKHITWPWRRALVFAALLGLPQWITPRRRSRGEETASAAGPSCGGSSRPLVGLATWLVVGVLFFGFFGYQVTRWLYFSVFPLAFLCTSLIARWVPPRHCGVAFSALIALHLVSQASTVLQYAERPEKTSLIDSARDVARRIETGASETVLIGNCGHLAALYGEHIRPIVGTCITPEDLRERIRRWHPSYFVGRSDELRPIQEHCADLIAGFELVARYRVIENYVGGEDMRLIRLVYREGASPPQ